MSGARAASSHTGALAGSDKVVDALFQQAGVIRTETLEEMFDVAALLAHQPHPAGPRVAILTNAGGPGHSRRRRLRGRTVSSCRCSSEATRDRAAAFPAGRGERHEPGRHAGVGASRALRAARSSIMLRDENVDSVLTIFIPPLVTEPDAVAAAIASVRRRGARQADPRRLHAGRGRAGGARVDPVLRVSRNRPRVRSRA